MSVLDDFLLGKVAQPVADRLAPCRTQIEAGWAAFLLGIVSVAAAYISHATIAPDTTSAHLWMLGLLVVPCMLLVTHTEMTAAVREDRACANSLRLRLLVMRHLALVQVVAFAGLCVPGWGCFALDVLCWSMACAGLYLMSCQAGAAQAAPGGPGGAARERLTMAAPAA